MIKLIKLLAQRTLQILIPFGTLTYLGPAFITADVSISTTQLIIIAAIATIAFGVAIIDWWDGVDPDLPELER